MTDANKKKVTPKQIETIFKNFTTKSDQMKEMYKLGIEIKEIANIMTVQYEKLVRYNFVYNVISNACIVSGETINTNKKEGKNKEIVEMYLKGMSNKEIAIELKTHYNYVFNTIKKYKIEKEGAIETGIADETEEAAE